MKNKAAISHDKVMIQKIRSKPGFAEHYHKAAIEDTDEPKVLLLAPRGNPRRSTLLAVTRAIGLTLTLQPA